MRKDSRRRLVLLAILALLLIPAGILMAPQTVHRTAPSAPAEPEAGPPSAPARPDGPEAASAPGTESPEAPVPEHSSPTHERRPPSERVVLTGRLLDADGNPLAGVEIAVGGETVLDWLVELRRTSEREIVGAGSRSVFVDGRLLLESWPLGRTEADGSFRIDRPFRSAGSFDLAFFGKDGLVHRAAGLALAPGGETEFGTIRVEPAGSIVGTVTREDGSPAAGARVFGLPTDGLLAARDSKDTVTWALAESPWTDPANIREAVVTEADERGGFALAPVPPGRWRVYATADDRGAAIGEIEVASGGESGPVSVVLDRHGGTIAGRLVEAATGAPIEDGFVRVPSLDRSVLTNEDGSFDLGAVGPGPLRIVAGIGRRRAWFGPYQIEAGAALDLRFEIPEDESK